MPSLASSRRAFTLLEVLVALGLSVLLVTAIYAAISMYVHVSQDETAVLERSRVARSLFRQMTLDIQSVLYRPQEEDPTAPEEDGAGAAGGASTSTSTSAGSTSDTPTADEGADSTAAVDPEAALQSTSVGLIGDAQKLTLHISRPSRDLSYATIGSGGTLDVRTSDLQSITWFLANASSSGLEGAVGQLAAQDSGTGLTAAGPQGLARLAGDRMAIEYADVEADVDSLALAAQVLAPEVVSLDFRYFDGLTWQPEWDSVASQRLPNAVEITIGLKRVVPLEERLANQFNPAARAAMDEVVELRRHVVSLPLAEPYTAGL